MSNLHKYLLNKDILYFLFRKIPSILQGKLRKNLIFAYWGHSLNNFGDLLTPMILKYYGLTPVHAYPRKAQLASVGTILGFMSDDYDGVIVGSGINNPIPKSFKNAKVLGLRGVLTQKTLGLSQDTSIVLGDPGLLVSRIFPIKGQKRWRLGIVPHLSELRHPIVRRWESELSEDIVIINVLRKPELVIKEISACDYIISSSLHGLIIADSFEIPNMRYIMPDASTYEYEHNYFRFDDYYSVLGVPHEYIQLLGNEKESDLMNMKFRNDFSMLEPIKDNLDRMLKEFVASFLQSNK